MTGRLPRLPVYALVMPVGDTALFIDAFESHRHFELWRYEVGHAQLLLRSVKSDQNQTRIDVLFKVVEAIDLPTSFDGLRLERHDNAFGLSGVGWSGSVIAGACFRAEDTGEYFDPSPFADSMPGA